MPIRPVIPLVSVAAAILGGVASGAGEVLVQNGQRALVSARHLRGIASQWLIGST